MGDSLMDEMAEDAAEPEAPDPSQDPTMARLVKFGNEMEEIRNRLDELKDAKKEITVRYDELRFTIIPDLMQQVGIVADGKGRFTNSQGALISLRTDLHAGFNKDEEPKVFKWLRASDMGDVIRETVHPSTFKSLIREQVADGKAVPEFVRVHYETSAMLRRSKK